MATRVSEQQRQGDAISDIPRVLAVKLETGDELEIGAGTDLASAREQLASFYSDIDTHKFVRFDDDTVVRSSQIAFLQLRERGGGSGGDLMGTVKSRIGGGNDMSTYRGDEGSGSTSVRVAGSRGQEMGYGSGMRQPQPLFDPSPKRGSETKPFFLTSEFLTTAGVIAALAIAMSQLDSFNADRGWLLITAIAAAFVLSRGIAKAGTRSVSDDPRDRFGWGDGDR